jgi:hypothetical protein
MHENNAQHSFLTRFVTKQAYVKEFLLLSISMALQLFGGPWPSFSFLISTQLVGPFGWGTSPHKAATCTQDSTQTQNKHTSDISYALHSVLNATLRLQLGIIVSYFTTCSGHKGPSSGAQFQFQFKKKINIKKITHFRIEIELKSE